jgi:hypothetical protein
VKNFSWDKLGDVSCSCYNQRIIYVIENVVDLFANCLRSFLKEHIQTTVKDQPNDSCMSGDHMPQWEYHSDLLVPVYPMMEFGGWKLKSVDEQEKTNWKKTEIYNSIAEFCNQIGKQGWELVSVVRVSHSGKDTMLYFKRPVAIK